MGSSATPRRIVALWFPRLATDRLQRRWQRSEGPPPPDAPGLVVAGRSGNTQLVAALDRKASALGLYVGQPLANARAMVPALRVVAEDAPADAKLLARIADWCDRYTPFVALDPPRGLLLDVSGVGHLFDGEQALLDRIRAELRRQGFAVRGAMASTALAARALARHRDGCVVAPGDESKAVAPLPIEALDLDEPATHAFRRAGLKTIGQAAGRKRAELTARFGSRLVYMIDTALARANAPISPRRPLPDYRAERNFAEPVATEDIIRQTLLALAGALSELLEKRGEGARRLEAVFFRADGIVRRIAVEAGAPLREPNAMVRLFHEKLAALADPLDPGFGFDLIRLCADRIGRAEAEAQQLDSDAGRERELRLLVDRLAARFGRDRILAFHPCDTNIPEHAFALLPAQHAGPAERPWKKLRGAKEAPRRPLRLFARPERLGLLRAVDGRYHMRWRNTQRLLTRIEGPERIAMEWWRSAEPTRDYYRVEDENGRRFWLCRDAQSGQWSVQGGFA